MRTDMQRRTPLTQDVSSFQARERGIDPPGILMLASHRAVLPLRFCLIHGSHQFTGSAVCSAQPASA